MADQKTQIGDETQKQIETQFLNYCKTNSIKYRSKEYYKAQHAFVLGACVVFTEYIGANDFVIPPKWGVALMSQREIIEKY